MPHLKISTSDVADVGSAMAAFEGAPSTAVTVPPPAKDPVSVTVARTLAARAFALTGYSSTANAIAQQRGQMVIQSASAYTEQEAANTATLGDGAPVPAGGSPNAPAAAIPPLPSANIPPPAIGAPPAGGKAIAELIHSGSGPSGLHSAASQLRQHASALSLAGTQLQGHASTLEGSWDSAAGGEATSKITELATWYDRHAQAATSAADAIDQQAANFGQARQSIPPPEDFALLERKLQMAELANAAPGSFGRYTSTIATLRTQLADLDRQAVQGYSTYSTGGTDAAVVGEPLEAPPRPGGNAQMVGYSPAVPQSGPGDWDEVDWGDMETVGPELIDPGGARWDGVGAGNAPVSYSPHRQGPYGLGDGEWELNEWGQPQPVWPTGGGGGGASGGDGGAGVAPVSYNPAVPQSGPGDWDEVDWGDMETVGPELIDPGGARWDGVGAGNAPVSYSPNVPQGPYGLGDGEWELNEWGQPQPVWPTGGGGGGASGGNSGVGTAPV